MNLLVIDDEKDLLASLGRFLRIQGYQVQCLQSGSEFFRHLEMHSHSKIDLILMDYMMPDITGLDILATIRNNNILTPVIIMTGFADNYLRQKAQSLGCKAIIDKPFDSFFLVELIQKTLAPSDEKISKNNGKHYA